MAGVALFAQSAQFDEGHGVHNEENRFDFYGAMEKFLEKYPQPAT